MRLSQKQKPKNLALALVPRGKQLIPEILFALVLGYVVLFDGSIYTLFHIDKVVINTGLIVLVSLAWLAWRTINRRPFPQTHLDPAILAILGTYLLAAAFSNDPRRSLIVLPNLFSAILFFYLTVDLIRRGLPAHHIGWTLVTITIPVVLTGLAQLLFWYRSWLGIAGWSDPVPPVALRIPSTFGHPNILAAYMVLILPIIITLAIRLGWTKSGIRTAFFAFLVLAIQFFTSSRGGWLATAVVLAIIGIYCIVRWRSTILNAIRGLLRKPVWVVVLAVIGIALLFLSLKVAFWVLDHPSHGSMFSLNREGIWGPAVDFFKAHPIIGYGPNLYGDMFLKYQSVPPVDPMPHAHSVPLAVLSETGLVGFAALLFLVVLLVIGFRKQWNAAGAHDRWYLIGVVTALAGFAVHSQFDFFLDTPGIFIVVAVLAAQIAAVCDPSVPDRSPIAPRQPQQLPHGEKWKQIGLTAACGVLIACTLWNLYTYVPYARGIEAGAKQDWKTAAESLDLAAQRDPLLAVNWFQSGMAHGRLAINEDGSLRDAGELDAALERYETGLQMDPSYAVHWANLAALRWAAGDQAGAIDGMVRAGQLAPQSYIFPLTLGKWLEASGQSGAAKDAYVQALFASPVLAGSVNIQESAVRIEALEEWKNRSTPGANSPFAEGWDLLLSSKTVEAVGYFDKALETKDMEAYLGLSEAYLQAGRLDEAQKQLSKFFFIYPDNDWQIIRGILTLQKIALQSGDQNTVRICAEALEKMIDSTSAFGLSSKRYNMPSVRFYSRDSLLGDLLPGIERVITTPDIVEALDQLSN